MVDIKDFGRASRLSPEDYSEEQRVADGIKLFAYTVGFRLRLPLPLSVRKNSKALAKILEETKVVETGDGLGAVESLGNFSEFSATIYSPRLIIDRPENTPERRDSYRIRYGAYGDI